MEKSSYLILSVICFSINFAFSLPEIPLFYHVLPYNQYPCQNGTSYFIKIKNRYKCRNGLVLLPYLFFLMVSF